MGKSTFINALIGKKVSITSNIPQTTRNKILAIYNTDTTQFIFFDTPWIHSSEKSFNQLINSQALWAISDADVVLYFHDSTRAPWEEESYIAAELQKTNTPIIHVYTKTDIQLPMKTEKNSFCISSTEQDGFIELLNEIETHFSTQPSLFPEEIYTKQDLFFRVSEIIRGRSFDYVREELPHSVYIDVADVEDTPKMYKINAYIYVESDSQKYIVIWKQGSLIKKIATESRIELEEILEKKVFLTLRVKVRKNWRKDENFIKNHIKK